MNPLKEIDADLSECSLLYAIYLFRCCEGLSPEGKKIVKAYSDKLYDALFDYEFMRFPNELVKERTRRQTHILMIISKISVSYFS